MSKEAWNVFKNIHVGTTSASEASKKQTILCIPIEILTCLLKFLVYILAFSLVLSGSVLSKISMLLMTSQIQHRKISPFCNNGLDRMKDYLVEISTKEQVCKTLFFDKLPISKFLEDFVALVYKKIFILFIFRWSGYGIFILHLLFQKSLHFYATSGNCSVEK